MYDYFRQSRERVLRNVEYIYKEINGEDYLFVTGIAYQDNTPVASYTKFWDKPIPKEQREDYIKNNRVKEILDNEIRVSCKYPVPGINDFSYLISPQISGTRTRA